MIVETPTFKVPDPRFVPDYVLIVYFNHIQMSTQPLRYVRQKPTSHDSLPRGIQNALSKCSSSCKWEGLRADADATTNE
jgi:hypothetical protein